MKRFLVNNESSFKLEREGRRLRILWRRIVESEFND